MNRGLLPTSYTGAPRRLNNDRFSIPIHIQHYLLLLLCIVTFKFQSSFSYDTMVTELDISLIETGLRFK